MEDKDINYRSEVISSVLKILLTTLRKKDRGKQE